MDPFFKRFIWTISILGASALPAGSSIAAEVPAQDQVTIQKLIQAVTHQDSVGVAKLIQFPLKRVEPLRPIRNVPQFIEHYEEFFDQKTVADLLGAMSSPVRQGRWTTLRSGMVWILDGKITAINLQTAKGDAALKQIQEQKNP